MMEMKDTLWLKSGREGLTTSGDDSFPPIKRDGLERRENERR